MVVLLFVLSLRAVIDRHLQTHLISIGNLLRVGVALRSLGKGAEDPQ